MNWLNMLKTQQEAAQDTIRSFPIVPPEAVPKVPKVKTPEQDDIFAPDSLDVGTPASDGKDLPLYCADGDCWCSQKLPVANYPTGCSKCNM